MAEYGSGNRCSSVLPVRTAGRRQSAAAAAAVAKATGTVENGERNDINGANSGVKARNTILTGVHERTSKALADGDYLDDAKNPTINWERTRPGCW